MRQVSQSNYTVPEAIKLKTALFLFGGATLLSNLLKINFIFQILSIERHSDIGGVMDYRIAEVRDHTGNKDRLAILILTAPVVTRTYEKNCKLSIMH